MSFSGKFLKLVLALLVTATALAQPAAARDRVDDRDWVQLRSASRAIERGVEILRFDDNIGRFNAIAVQSVGGSMRVDTIRVRTQSGERSYRINQDLRANERSSLVQLPDEQSLVRSIEVETSRKSGGRPAIWGMIGRDRDGYELMATARIAGAREDYMLAFGDQADKPISKIKFRVWEGVAELRRAEVLFDNNETQEITIRDRLAPGEDSGTLDLDGSRRRVKGVRITMRTGRNSDATRIDVLGLRGSAGGVFAGRGDDDRMAPRIDDRRVDDRRGDDRRADDRRGDDRRADDRRGDDRRADDRRGDDRRGDDRRGDDRRVDDRRGDDRRGDDRRGDDRRADDRRGDDWSDARRLASRDREMARGWELLGTSKAAMLSSDKDVIEVGRREGRFSAIRVRVQKADVRMYSAVVVYGNGEREEVPISGTLNAGEISEPFDLKGRGRSIERVEFNYKTKLNLNLRGSAVVEVWGLSRN
ncbi:MAG: hypothetical protein ACK4MF_00785 [Hyphomicrobiaceae bacterium]